MKTTFLIYCRQCHREGEANVICDRHTAFKPVMRCDFCNSINVKVIGIEAQNGVILGTLAYSRPRMIRRGGEARS